MATRFSRRCVIAGVTAVGSTIIVKPTRAADHQFVQYHNQPAGGTLHKKPGAIPDFYYGETAGDSIKFAGTGIYNVRDFGAVGDGKADDRGPIQAALDRALTAPFNPGQGKGGIVFFPPGVYKINRGLTVSGDSTAGIRLVGSGVGMGSFNGSIISGNFNDYLLKTTHKTTSLHDQMPISSLEHLAFVNNASLARDIVDTESCGGCLYLTGTIGLSIYHCGFRFHGGIGFYNNGQNCSVRDCQVAGNYNYVNAGRTVGMFIGNGLMENCKIEGVGIGVIGASSGADGGCSIWSNKVDVESSGCGMALGYVPFKFWDSAANGLIDGSNGFLNYGYVSHSSMETIGDDDNSSLSAFIYIGTAINLTIDRGFWGTDTIHNPTKYGIKIINVHNCDIKHCYNQMTPGFQTAAISVQKCNGLRFRGMDLDPLVGGGQFFAPPTDPAELGADGFSFEDSNIDGAIPITVGGASSNTFPLAPTAVGQTMIISDSPFPAFDTASNVGRPISAIAVTSAQTLAPSKVLHFTIGTIPTYLGGGAADGWEVFGQSTADRGNIPANTVIAAGGVNLAAGTITLNNPVTGTIKIGSTIAFVNGTGSYKALVRWNGVGWCIAG